MYSFKNDYSESAHPSILKAIGTYNMQQEEGYGMDGHCEAATQLIKKAVKEEAVDVHFLSGGTQTNLITISSCLRPYEACVSASTGHICTHEAGAIEATGHKVVTIDTLDGKLTPELLKPTLTAHQYEHNVKIKLVYISNPTELGTVYTKNELEALYQFCQASQLYLYLDGARLASALVVPEAELSLEVINKNTDAFFIGGTKNGALFGEALVISNQAIQTEFRYMLKQKGALLAKGYLLGIQFKTLLEDDFYLELARHAVSLAQVTQKRIKIMGYEMLVDSQSNQLFPILPNAIIERLSQKYLFHIWKEMSSTHSCIRLVFSWATVEEKVREFLNDLSRMSEVK